MDSYAIIEIIKNNKNFRKFEKTPNSTGFMNLLEVHYITSRYFDVKNADIIINKLKGMVIELQLEDIKEASRFRTNYIKKKFSYIDCLGYAMAVNRNLKFVTGDNQFKGLPNIEFIK